MGISFGVMPYDTQYWPQYGAMNRRVRLKQDLGWREVQHLQNILRKGDIWDGFPARGYTLVAAEVKAGDEEQRIDILYIRNDGALLPCELKVGGTALDTHGQLIRYISDMYFQHVDLAWVRRYHEGFLSSIDDDVAKSLHAEKFNAFITDNGIEDRFIRLLPKSGVIIDEEFKPQLLKAVRYLNGYCGFSIRLIQIETFVDEQWEPTMDDFLFRIDFVDVQ